MSGDRRPDAGYGRPETAKLKCFTASVICVVNCTDAEITLTEMLKILYNNNNNDRLTAFDPGQPG